MQQEAASADADQRNASRRGAWVTLAARAGETAGTMASSNGSASAAAPPRKKVRRGRYFQQ